MSTTNSPRRKDASASSDFMQSQVADAFYDYLLKFILVGPSGCGKSCILHRFIRGEWPATSSHTVGVEFANKVITIGSGTKRTRMKLQLWDTAGQERFRSVTRSYYRGAASALLVYDITSRPSFLSLDTWLADLRALASKHISIILIGNKSDLAAEGREVSIEEAGRWADRQNIDFVELSALSGDGVEAVFAKAASKVLTKLEMGIIDPSSGAHGIQIGDNAWNAGDGASIGLESTMRRRRGDGNRIRAASTRSSLWSEMEEIGYDDSANSRKQRQWGCC